VLIYKKLPLIKNYLDCQSAGSFLLHKKKLMLAHEQAEIQRIDNVLFHIFVLSLYSG